MRAKFRTISIDISRFEDACPAVRLVKLVGTSVDQNLSMAIAASLSKQIVLSYEAKNYAHNTRLHQLAYKTLQNVPRCNDELQTTDSWDESLNKANYYKKEEYCDEAAAGTANDAAADESVASSLCSTPEYIFNWRATFIARGTFVIWKRAKLEKVRYMQNEQSVYNRKVIAAAMMRCSMLIEEQNAMHALALEACVIEEKKERKSLVYEAYQKNTP